MTYSLIPFVLALGLPSAETLSAQKSGALTAPESFTSQVQTRTSVGGAGANMRIQIDRYNSEFERKTMTDAMTHGGYPGFVLALRKGSEIGHLQLGDQKFPLRWAREQPAGKGRAITLVADKPVYFVGGGRADAKPREGYELAVVQLTLDEFGMGKGTMAAAARVKPDGKGGVVLEDYAEEPIQLTFVRREIK
jgi:hypothetical protein